MNALRYFRNGNTLPDVVVITIDHGKPRRNSSYLEKMVFYRDTLREGRLLVVSKDIVEESGGFDTTLGFGEDRLFQYHIFRIVKIDEKTRKRFEV